jgi:hypothetical protein
MSLKDEIAKTSPLAQLYWERRPRPNSSADCRTSPNVYVLSVWPSWKIAMMCECLGSWAERGGKEV